jgi:hypothetical protein
MIGDVSHARNFDQKDKKAYMRKKLKSGSIRMKSILQN